MQKTILNIGILAHVDAGKTTLTEQLLFHSGAIQTPGSVDKGSTTSDNLALEKQRGITIQNTSVGFDWKNTRINLIDTPGHVDFSAEVDRAVSVLDGVVLLVSAVEGVQAHTLNIWESIRELDLPVLIFINKMDRAGACGDQVFSDLQDELKIRGFCLNLPAEDGSLIPWSLCDFSQNLLDQSFANLAEMDEDVLESYLEETLSSCSGLDERVADKIRSQALVPVHFGIAKQGMGIADLADSLVKIPCRNPLLQPSHLLPDQHDQSDQHGQLDKYVQSDQHGQLDKHASTQQEPGPSAQVFKVEHHEKFGRLAYIRVYAGVVESKTSLYCRRLNKEIKVNQLLQNRTGRLEVIKALPCNDIGIIAVSHGIISGDTLGRNMKISPREPIAHSVLWVVVEACDDKDYQELSRALQILDMEDPVLDFTWDKEDREFRLKIIGPMQTEILTHMLQERFNLLVDIKPPQVIYQETIVEAAEAEVRYTMPKPCWAVMRFKVEPGKLNSGVVFESLVGVDDISQKYQNEVARAVPWALHQGMKGWPVTDIKISLLGGEEHTMHSNPGDFLLATPMGIMNAVKNAGTRLLEPFYDFDIKAPRDLLGTITNDLNNMKALMEVPLFEQEGFTLRGRVAVGQAMDYSIRFNACCSGKGRLKLRIGGYQPCGESQEKIRDYKGVNPLDRSQWILHNRGALKPEDRIR